MTRAPSLRHPERASVAAAASHGGSLVQRLVAGGYGWIFDHVDPLGGADHRRRLVEQATGAVLEIGPGPAATCPVPQRHPRHGPGARPGCAYEPTKRPSSPGARESRRRHGGTPALPRRRLRHGGGKPGAVHHPRPCPDAGRSPPGPAPGGTLRLYQHGRVADPRLARWQDRLQRPWGWLAAGCHPKRDVAAAITAAGFRLLELDRFDFQIMPPLVRPHVLGVAERPASRASTQQAKGMSQARRNVLVIGAT
jgi:hypothetical protein